MHTILVVDDDEDTRVLLERSLTHRGYRVHAVDSAQACLDRLREEDVDLVITDFQMPVMSGIELCEQLRERHPNVLSLMLTAVGTYDAAISTVRAGAYDFLTKPVRVDVLVVAIERALAHLDVTCEVKRLRSASQYTAPIPGLVGSSKVMREMTTLVRRVADSDATVLITGESGTGKELVARALHDLSERKEAPFIAVNCGAISTNLLESELFGHVKGAFTDARSDRNGLFQQAGNGTIFLDEIGEMPLEMQVKLLRVLQQHTVRPVGGDSDIAFQARVVTATNRDLEVEVAEGRFREDLFYRLNVVPIAVPPLRTRNTDVVLVANAILERLARRAGKRAPELTPETTRKLLSYDWPGNVRELENCVERAVAMCGDGPIDVRHLPIKIVQHQPDVVDLSIDAPDRMLTLDELERRYVRQVLESHQGNKTQAARALGINRRSLYRRLDPNTAS